MPEIWKDKIIETWGGGGEGIYRCRMKKREKA